MTIRKGEPWGRAVSVPPGLTILADDAAVGRHVTEARRRGTEPDPVGVRTGDLARTLGGGAEGRFDGAVTEAPVDVLRVVTDGGTWWAAAHVAVHRGLRNEVYLAMNAQYWRGRDAAPRSHPNDGRFDVLEVDRAMSLRDRRRAWQRARTGTHVPHPKIATRRATEVRWDFARPLDLYIDHIRVARHVKHVEVLIEPDALTLLA